jgi:peptidoglycan DL-endopeptidase RipA
MTHIGAPCGQSNYYQPAGSKGRDCFGLSYERFEHAGVHFPWSISSAIKSGVPQMVIDR